MPKTRNIDTLTLDGGILCFNFINTVYAWRGLNLHEYLPDYEEVIKWCKKVNILGPAKRAQLLKEAGSNPFKAREALQQMIRTREMLYQFFSAIASDGDEPVPPKLVSAFNKILPDALLHLAIEMKEKQIEVTWKNADNNLLEPLWIVIKSAYDILTSEDFSRIKECGKCGWIFIDRTKNNKRRWCNPALCGSIEKSKKYYRKTKKSAGL